MAISPELIEVLRCQVCKNKIELAADEKSVKCVECRRVYPVIDEIPVMIADDEAKIEELTN